MSPSSTVPPGPPQPGGGGGGGGSGGNAVGPSGPVDVGEVRLAGPSDVGEWLTPLTVPELVPWETECPTPSRPPALPAEDSAAPLESPTDKGWIMLMSGSESGEVLECWRRVGGGGACRRSVTRTLPELG